MELGVRACGISCQRIKAEKLRSVRNLKERYHFYQAMRHRLLPNKPQGDGGEEHSLGYRGRSYCLRCQIDGSFLAPNFAVAMEMMRDGARVTTEVEWLVWTVKTRSSSVRLGMSFDLFSFIRSAPSSSSLDYTHRQDLITSNLRRLGLEIPPSLLSRRRFIIMFHVLASLFQSKSLVPSLNFSFQTNEISVEISSFRTPRGSISGEEIISKTPTSVNQRSTIAARMKELNVITARKRDMPLSAEEIVEAVAIELASDTTCGRGPANIQASLKADGIHAHPSSIPVLSLYWDGIISGMWTGTRNSHQWDIRSMAFVTLGGTFIVNGWFQTQEPKFFLKKTGGVPITVTSDKRTVTGNLYALQTSIREEADPTMDTDVVPAHLFLRSLKNIVIERSWKDWLRERGRNLGLFFTRNSRVAGFVPENPIHRCLANWIWIPLIQQELDKFVSKYNSRKIRRLKEKVGPSGASHTRTFNFPELFDGKSQLIEVDGKLSINSLCLQEFKMRPGQQTLEKLYAGAIVQPEPQNKKRLYDFPATSSYLKPHDRAYLVWRQSDPLISHPLTE
ncbi:hypothetical protein SISSUDRAFT_1037068 [Sistotremastrum suecicum HHB10207 ss-3]|uniref:Integrase core domain-containing protein n=1 Tax=Sistotremastrum suecicum HHB10207 ss-3 TaxID=1314776 RepID=A0A165YMV1_9AGAM|nr:hypothetical protein SISSUDRAFT_1037068 [Sistotremastrum suecicum HHB10207 ss-3]